MSCCVCDVTSYVVTVMVDSCLSRQRHIMLSHTKTKAARGEWWMPRAVIIINGLPSYARPNKHPFAKNRRLIVRWPRSQTTQHYKVSHQRQRSCLKRDQQRLAQCSRSCQVIVMSCPGSFRPTTDSARCSAFNIGKSSRCVDRGDGGA